MKAYVLVKLTHEDYHGTYTDVLGVYTDEKLMERIMKYLNETPSYDIEYDYEVYDINKLPYLINQTDFNEDNYEITV